MTFGPWEMKRYYQTKWKTGTRNFRYFLIVIIITIIVQHSIYWTLSQRTTHIQSERRVDYNGHRIENSTMNRRRRQTNGGKLKVINNFKGNFCNEKLKWKMSRVLGEVTSDMEYWSFDERRQCPEVDIDRRGRRQRRLKGYLKCEGLSFKWTNDNSDIYKTDFSDECVENYISNCCHGVNSVPNVVHYVWYLRGELSFVGFMSLLSVIRFVNPCLIIFHGSTLPSGRYWNFIVNISPNIIHLERARPSSIFGQKIYYAEHSGDIMRIEALLKYGGIYLDTDTVLVRPIDELRKYPCVMSTQHRKLGSAFILAEKNSTFLHKWLDGYRYRYTKLDYSYNAMTYPQLLALKYSDLIHIEKGTVSRPKDMIGRKFYSSRYEIYDWSKVYGVHLYTRLYRGPLNETTIRNMHSPCGSILRHVLYGNKELCI